MENTKTMKRAIGSALLSVGRWMGSKLAHQLVPNVGTLVAVALLLFVYHAWAAPGSTSQAAVPASGVSSGLLSYQGYLTNASGEPLTGDVDITFRLYSAQTGGTALWTEAHTEANAVPVDDGLFNVMLGSLTPIPDDVWNNGARYLGIQVGDDAEMSPREMVGNVPIAMTVPNGSVTAAKLAPTAVGKWTMPNDGQSIGFSSGAGFDWQTVDLSTFLPTTAEIVYVKLWLRETGGNGWCSIRPQGSTSSAGIEIHSPVANQYASGTAMIALHDSKIEWKCQVQSGATIGDAGISLWGYYEPGH